MEYDTAGDPVSGLKWTKKTPRKIARQLGRLGINIGERSVSRLLKDLGFSLRKNRKNIESGGKSSVEPELRDKQFKRIKNQRKAFSNNNNPCISVDTKKKELIGLFKNDGTKWDDQAMLVYDHDFPSDADGKAIPYGIYDVQTNQGSVFVGHTHDTPSFAVESIEKWWKYEGRMEYPDANEILILADCGGSNSYRARMWKYQLQNILCNKYQLKVTVCHYPPGSSKWNPIEHRLFSEISKNWAATPLTCFNTVLKYIRTTKTETGLKVKARFVKKTYKNGEIINQQEFEQINISFAKVANPLWNYTIEPSRN